VSQWRSGRDRAPLLMGSISSHRRHLASRMLSERHREKDLHSSNPYSGNGTRSERLKRLSADITLRCRECGRDFIFTTGEQAFYASRGLTNQPSRCPECRAARKASQSGGYSSSRSQRNSDRQMYTAQCSNCGREAQVPFQPRGDRPVYCSDCYRQVNTPSYSSYR
jgi:CxxC-x17-CxxC domain-containing protein